MDWPIVGDGLLEQFPQLRGQFVVPPSGGIRLIPAKAGTTNDYEKSGTALARMVHLEPVIKTKQDFAHVAVVLLNQLADELIWRTL